MPVIIHESDMTPGEGGMAMAMAAVDAMPVEDFVHASGGITTGGMFDGMTIAMSGSGMTDVEADGGASASVTGTTIYDFSLDMPTPYIIMGEFFPGGFDSDMGGFDNILFISLTDSTETDIFFEFDSDLDMGPIDGDGQSRIGQ